MEAARLQSAIYRTIVDTAGDAFILTNSSDQILAFNSNAVTKIFGYSLEEMANVDMRILLPEMTGSSHDNFLLRAATADEGLITGFGHSVSGRRKDGSIVPLDLSIAEAQDTTGARCFNWIMRDVTERMNLYQDLRDVIAKGRAAAEIESALLLKVQASNHELKTANEDLQKFSSIVAHDLRGPLRRIEAFVAVLAVLETDFRSALSDEGVDILDRIARGALRMKLMLDSLLQYSRYNSVAISGKTAHLADFVGDAMSVFDTDALNIQVLVELNGVTNVRGDTILLSHVLQNLIGNAVKFRSDFSSAISIEAEYVDDLVIVSVTDNGIGIEPKFSDKIFEMFYRLHDDDEYEGTGIGLTVCRKIINDHGGRIWLAAADGGKTKFSFTLQSASEEDLLAVKAPERAKFRVSNIGRLNVKAGDCAEIS